MITTISRTSAQVIGNSEATGTFSFNNIVTNDFGCVSQDPNLAGAFLFPTNGISITYPGTYIITANVSFPVSTAGGIRYISIVAPNGIFLNQLTNITNVSRSQVSIASAIHPYSLSVSVAWRLSLDTVIQMRVWQTGASSSVSTAIANATLGTVNASLSAALILQ